MATETRETASETRTPPKPIADALHDIVANSVGLLDDLLATRRRLAGQAVEVASAALTRIAWSAGAAAGRTEADAANGGSGGA